MTVGNFFLFALRPFWKYLIGLAVMSFGWALVINVQPYVLHRIIDTISYERALLGDGLFMRVFWFIAMYLGLGFSIVLLIRYHHVFMAFFAPRQREFLSLSLMDRMMQHSASFYVKNLSGSLTNRINEITIYTPEVVDICINDFLTCFLTLIFALYNLSTVHYKFALALVVWLSIFLGLGTTFLFRNTHLVGASAESRAQVVGRIVDMISNMLSIRLFSKKMYEQNFLKKVTTESKDRDQKRDFFHLHLQTFQGFSFWIFEIICFWWLLHGIVDGSITAGAFVLILTMNLQILDQFWKLSKEVQKFWEKLGSIRQALKVIYQESDARRVYGDAVLQVTKGKIVFDKVQFFYEDSVPLFEDKTIVISGGQKVGLVGYSGSGKSTFINLILRLYDVTEGRISIDDQDISDVTEESLYKAISVIPQDCCLFNRSIMDNIRYGRETATDEEVYEAAKKAELHDVICRLPHGYQTMLGDRGGRLSGGQRQRVVIARAILKNAPILIIDEATSHQDGITESKLKSMLSTLIENKTVLFVSHRLTTLEGMDRVLVFDGGRIVQDGPHEKLLKEEGMYRALWSLHKESLRRGEEGDLIPQGS